MAETETPGGAGQHAEEVQAEPDKSEVQWLISYSDFMMQLVILFVLLYSVSQVDVAKLTQVAEGYREYKGIGIPIKKGSELPTGPIPSDPKTDVIRLLSGETYKVSATSEGTLMTIGGEFHPFGDGEWILSQQHKTILDDSLKYLKGRFNIIYIKGYTNRSWSDSVIRIESDGEVKYRKFKPEDNENPNIAKIADHWQLGMLRAQETYKYLVSKGLDSKFFLPMSMSFSNLISETDPKLNRRVVILISPHKVKD